MADETKPMAGDGEPSVTATNMSGSPVGVVPSEPVDYAAKATEAAKGIQSPDKAVMMSDADALKVGRDIEARYVPPAPGPSVLEQLAAMKKPA